MRILIINSDYPSFLKWLYTRNSGLSQASYKEQLKARNDTLFGVADFYSRNFVACGHEAAEVIVNNIWLQTAWAREHGIVVSDPSPPSANQNSESGDLVMHLKRKLRPYKEFLTPLAKRLGFVLALTPLERQILLAQIEDFQPDVILNQELDAVDAKITRAVKRPGRVLIAQCGNQPPADLDVTPYNFGISLIPWVVEFYRSKGLPAENRHLAFEPSVLDRLGPAPQKDIDVSFVGGLASNHGKRIELLEAIAREFPVQLWLSNFKGISRSSPLHRCIRGEVWGSDMYNVLRRSKITLNSHIDAARGMAGNMRLYEATGVGTFLLTDNLPNLPSLFQPGVHVGAYDSVEDCLLKIKQYLNDDTARETIARAGQEHTLKHHTYRHRIEELLALIEKYAR
jgi:spore maturation protein CgeB